MPQKIDKTDRLPRHRECNWMHLNNHKLFEPPGAQNKAQDSDAKHLELSVTKFWRWHACHRLTSIGIAAIKDGTDLNTSERKMEFMLTV